MKVFISLVLSTLLLLGCKNTLPHKGSLKKGNPEKHTLVVGQIKIQSADSNEIALSKVRLEVLDKNNYQGISFDYFDTTPVDKRGFFAFKVPAGKWKLSGMSYSDSNSYASAPMSINIEAKAKTVVNVGEIVITATSLFPVVQINDNSELIQRYVRSLKGASDYQLSEIINNY